MSHRTLYTVSPIPKKYLQLFVDCDIFIEKADTLGPTQEIDFDLEEILKNKEFADGNQRIW